MTDVSGRSTWAEIEVDVGEGADRGGSAPEPQTAPSAHATEHGQRHASGLPPRRSPVLGGVGQPFPNRHQLLTEPRCVDLLDPFGELVEGQATGHQVVSQPGRRKFPVGV
jgi:hypothetical protein